MTNAQWKYLKRQVFAFDIKWKHFHAISFERITDISKNAAVHVYIRIVTYDRTVYWFHLTCFVKFHASKRKSTCECNYYHIIQLGVCNTKHNQIHSAFTYTSKRYTSMVVCWVITKCVQPFLLLNYMKMYTLHMLFERKLNIIYESFLFTSFAFVAFIVFWGWSWKYALFSNNGVVFGWTCAYKSVFGRISKRINFGNTKNYTN